MRVKRILIKIEDNCLIKICNLNAINLCTIETFDILLV